MSPSGPEPIGSPEPKVCPGYRPNKQPNGYFQKLGGGPHKESATILGLLGPDSWKAGICLSTWWSPR